MDKKSEIQKSWNLNVDMTKFVIEPADKQAAFAHRIHEHMKPFKIEHRRHMAQAQLDARTRIVD